MDFRMCPSCEQSVLDDDAQDCPFCGAAMDGSSGPTKPQQASATATATEKKAQAEQATPAAKASEPAKKTQDDDPFAVKPKGKQKAIALRRKPTAKINYRIVCPMCDSNGFGTEAVAGKEVKCPNPDCMMPIFTAPELEKKEPEKPKKSLLTPVNIFVAVAAIALVSIAGYFYSQIPDPERIPRGDYETDNGENTNNVVQDNSDKDNTNKPEKNTQTEVPVKQTVNIKALKEAVLTASTKSALQRGDNRSKPYCRQLNAEAHVAADDLTGALEQLDAFDRLESGLDHFKITPLVRIAWKQIEQGKDAEAARLVDQALEYAAKLPDSGVDAVRHAVALGTILTAMERYDDAIQLIKSREQVQTVPISAIRLAMITEDQSFNLPQSYQWFPLMEWSSPLSFAIAYSASSRDANPQVTALINAMSDPIQQSDALAGWMTSKALSATNSGTILQPDQVPEIQGLMPFDKLRAYAQALQTSRLKQTDDTSALTTLESQLEQQDVPAEAQIPEMMQVYREEFQYESTNSRIIAHAHLLLARSFAHQKNSEAAWSHLQSAMNFLSSIGPNLNHVNDLIEEATRNRNGLTSQIAAKLEITGTIEKRNAFNQYRNNLSKIADAATLRQTYEEKVYLLAVEWGLALPLYEHFEAGQFSIDSHLHQLIETKLGPEILFAMRSTNDESAVAKFLERWPNIAKMPSMIQTRQELSRVIQAGNAGQAQILQSKLAKIDSGQQWNQLRVACEFAEKNPVIKVMDWLDVINSTIEKEQAYQFVAIQMTRRGLVKDFWDESNKHRVSATESCSRNLGLMEGLATSPDVYDTSEGETESVSPAEAE